MDIEERLVQLEMLQRDAVNVFIVGMVEGSRSADLKKAFARRDALRRQIADEYREMKAALEAVEWLGNGHYTTCPWCGHGPEYGHGEDCQRQASLARAGGES